MWPKCQIYKWNYKKMIPDHLHGSTIEGILLNLLRGEVVRVRLRPKRLNTSTFGPEMWLQCDEVHTWFERGTSEILQWRSWLCKQQIKNIKERNIYVASKMFFSPFFKQTQEHLSSTSVCFKWKLCNDNKEAVLSNVNVIFQIPIILHAMGDDFYEPVLGAALNYALPTK